MSLTYFVDVHCDRPRCRSWERGDSAEEVVGLAEVARARLKSLGWRREMVDGQLVDVCPTCAERDGIEPEAKPKRKKRASS